MTTAQQQQRHKHLLGHTIADGRLELVSILGLGAYGVVYLARDLTHPLHRQPFASTSSSDLPRILASRQGGAASGYYAVKCLNKVDLDARQKRFQRREIVLHTMVNGHPSVVTLYRVIDEKDDPCIYVILDYCPDGDLFSMITETHRYAVPTPTLGEAEEAAGLTIDIDADESYQEARANMDETVRSVFSQILDAVAYCHANGIYHRDLKPENILCLQGGARVVLADFGLATHEKVSSDFGCGSTFYMGPECQGGISTHLDQYSTPANDVWSLGVILVNLICGRNPWKQACVDDETFREYLRNPDFLMDILPISKQTNALLKRVFTVREEWRCSLAELRTMVYEVDRFTATQAELHERQRMARHAAQRARQEAARARHAAEEARRQAEIRHGVESVFQQPALKGAAAAVASITQSSGSFWSKGAQLSGLASPITDSDAVMHTRPATPCSAKGADGFATPSGVDSSIATVDTPGYSFSPGSSLTSSDISSTPNSPVESEADMMPDDGSSRSGSAESRRSSYAGMPHTPLCEPVQQHGNFKQKPRYHRSSLIHGLRPQAQQPTLAIHTTRATAGTPIDCGLQNLAIQSLLPHSDATETRRTDDIQPVNASVGYASKHGRHDVAAFSDVQSMHDGQDDVMLFDKANATAPGSNSPSAANSTGRFSSVPSRRGLRRPPLAANARRLRNNLFGS